MTKTSETIQIPWDFLRKYGYAQEECLFLTIETTGLSRKRSHLFLLGAVFYEEGKWVHRQWFCSRPSEEKEVLIEFSQLIRQKRLLIHFNGKSFHIPYLLHRYALYQLEGPFDSVIQLDLYQKLLPFKHVLGLEHMKQTDLENCMGLQRTEHSSGKELVSYYKQYLETGEASYMERLLLHNKENMSNLTKLLPLLTLPSLFSGELSSYVHADFSQYGIATLEIFLNEVFPLSFTWDIPLFHMELIDDCCTLKVPVFEGTLKYFYKDYKNYYYLPLEDEAIHKSVGIYVDAEHREQAKPSNCCKKRTGKFLPQTSSVFTPEFQKQYKGKELWFSLKDHPMSDPAVAGRYATHLLKESSAFMKSEDMIFHYCKNNEK